MVGMSGIETVEEIRKNPKTEDLKVAFLTVTNIDKFGKDMLEQLSIQDYITKPYNVDDLIARVQKIMG